MPKSDPYVIIGTRQNAPTTNQKVVANGPAKPVTININPVAMQLLSYEHTRNVLRIESVFQYDLSQRTLDGHQQGAIRRAILSKCGKTLSYKRKKQGLSLGVYPVGIPRTIAIRTPRLVWICIYSGLNTLRKTHELQHGNCTKVFHKIRGTHQENKETLFKTIDSYKICPSDRNLS